MNGFAFLDDECTQLFVRKAQSEDCMDVLRWRNDPLVCAMSRHPEPLSEKDHKAWYSQVLDDPNRFFLIGILNGQKVGTVRFDWHSDSGWEVSIIVSQSARGKGVGKHLLRLALKQFKIEHVSTSVQAVIRFDNEPSLRLFRSLGFRNKSNEGKFICLIFNNDMC